MHLRNKAIITKQNFEIIKSNLVQSIIKRSKLIQLGYVKK